MADEEREFSWKPELLVCWIYLDVKGKGLNREDWQPAPAVTHKICLSLPVSEGGERRRRRDRENKPYRCYFIFFLLFL